MSSTQMDLSPLVIDRKQDIASWPEGDIDQLAVRDKNRYQKRKSAIIDYFQTDLPVEEIAARHRLSAIDGVEAMARRCCTSHEDGRPWGFRALVPGARVVDARALASPSQARSNGNEDKEVLRAQLFSSEEFDGPDFSTDSTDNEDEDTSEHQALPLNTLTPLPQTPMPDSLKQPETPALIKARIKLPSDEDAVEDEDVLEVEQEEFPAMATFEGTETYEEVEQEAFPGTEQEAPELPGEDEDATSAEAELPDDEEVEQEEFPALASIPAATEEAQEVEQEEFPAPTDEAQETLAGEEVEQEEFPASVSEPAEEQEAQTASPVEAEVPDDEEVEQEEFPESTTLISDLAPTEEEAVAPVSQAAEVEEGEFEGDEDDLEGEPTGKLSIVRPPAREKPLQQEAEQEEEQAQEKDGSQDDEEDDAKVDTAEMARVAKEERLNRVAAVETIKVPAAMLEALEKADQQSQTRQSVASVETTALELKSPDAEPAVVQPPVPAEVPEPQSEVDDVAAVPTQALGAWKRDSQQPAQGPALKSPTQSLAEESRYRITGSQTAIKHAVLRRWGRQGRLQRQQQWVRVISAAVVVSILVILLIPLGVGLVGYSAYTNIKNVADDGVSNLLSLQQLIPANKNDLTAALNTQKLNTAKANLQKAQSDFLQLQDMVNRPDIQSLLQQFAPEYSGKLDSARRLVQVALDVSQMGQELIGVAQMGAGVLHGSGLLSSSSTKPLFTADDINTIEAALVHAQYYIGDIQTQMSQVNLSSLPLGSQSQKDKLAKYLGQIPQAQSAIAQAQTLIGPVSWMLGIGATRHFLVQTLDRGELRPSGGFEGQYGLLTLQNGRMSPFSLRDITLLDYAENGNELGATPPSQYGWMNFGNFGVRDANLSADYPTTAKIVMSYFQAEGGGPIDGDIQITPVVIEQFLQITGPIQIKDYNETITAQNLENKLHEYQQDPRLIAVQQQKTGQDTHATRKAFTNLVGTMLMDRIKHLPPTQLISFGKVLFKDLKTRDLQVYLNNPVAEQWLQQNNYSGAMPQFTNGNDGFMVVQSNISISKAAQYVKSTFKDDVTLDANGGATHNLTITLNYQQAGPVYGFDTYANYMRVYAPANAQLRNAYGFNTGSVLCTPGAPAKTTQGNGGGNKNNSIDVPASSGGGSYTDDGIVVSGCSQYWNTFTDTNARSCPDGNYRLGYDGMQARGWAYSNLGGPAQSHSDIPGYSMWGGMTLTPKNCTSTITLSWYVPHIVQNTPGQAPYRVIVGHQAGWPDTAQISINASTLKGVKNVNFNQVIDEDTQVSLAPLPGQTPQQKPGSTPTTAITPTATPKKP